MKMRPEDVSGDILPVLHVGEMVDESEAVAMLVKDRLVLYAGEWWENESWGNQILKKLQEERLTEANANALSVYLSDYVRDTMDVKEIVDIKYSVEGSRFNWECTVLTVYGSALVSYEI